MDAVASVTGICGDTMEVWLKIADGVVENATYWTDGCEGAIACGSMVTEMVRGMPVMEAMGVAAVDIAQALEGLPDAHIECTMLASKTLKKALLKYQLRPTGKAQTT